MSTTVGAGVLRGRLLPAAILLPLAIAVAAVAQGSAEDYRRADALPGAWTNLLRNESVEVRWIDADTPVYRYALADGTEQWRTVDLATGTIRPFFDERSIVDGLRERGVDVDRTPEIPWFDAHDGRLLMAFRGDTRLWAWDDRTRSLDELDPSELPDRFVLAPQPIDRTRSGGPVTSLIVVNASLTPVRLVWLDHDARARPYATIDPGAVHRQHTFAGHAWRVLDPLDADLGSYVAGDGPGLIMVRDAPMAPMPPVPPVPPDPPAPSVRPSAERSPDGRFTVEFSDHQVVLNDRDGTRTLLTQDGHEGDRYEGPVRWSPDSTRFVAMRTVPGDDRRIHMIESSPPDRLEPRLVSHRYRKPGDRVDVSRPRLFDATRGEMLDVDDAPIDDEPWSVGRVEWAPDSTRFYYLFNGRGHRIVRLIAVDARTGATRVVVEERSETFIDWTNKIFAHRIDATGELLWMSERSGWNHLHLIDLESGAVRNAVTAGEWVVRGVDHVDDETREVRLRVMGVRDGEDPYHVHYARVGFDGSGLSMLTEGDGTHRIDFSPDGSHYVNVWSRADLPPVTELRRTSDGALVATLAEADATALRASGWRPPERFVAKGRDGMTDIWGLIHAPVGLDASRAHPIVESIYAGPHGQHVPKAFSLWSSARALAELGFIVVQIDGMGTNWRSKAFHDVAHRNLKDAGFPDRIAWITAAATTRPWMDLSRIGIFGGSAGGQSALGALLFHSDFYRVAVADCGCHDNRMDKIWWNEQWMGWPVDDAYAANSNVAHAHRLDGRLLLAVGELDRNVDPASTMQVVDALIRADKDFDLLVFPGVGHGTLGTAYGTRRMRDFFVRHLHGVEPRWTTDPETVRP